MVSTAQARMVAGILGNTVSLALFLSPVPTFATICKRKSVERFSAAPYLATLLNCLLWILYGLPWVHPHSTLVITINGAGATIELAYVFLFILHSTGQKRRRVVAAFAAELLFVVAATAIILSIPYDHHGRSLIVGSLCVFFNTIMYAAPLSVMKMVIQTRSVEFLPLGISLASLVNGICWTCYAIIRFDLFITIPNGLGVILAIIQLTLHVIFRKSKYQERSMEEAITEDHHDSEKMVAPLQLHPSPYTQEK